MTAPYWSDGQVTLHLGDCLDVLGGMDDASVDAVVTDPPYGLEFMGKEWDGADGFRRSLNDADAGRDNVFGRTSKTSPEYNTGRFSGAVTDRDFKGFVLSQQRTRNVKCPDCGKWAYDHPGRLCECGGIRRAQVNVYQQWCEQWARECLRVLKPGGWMLAFGGTRTWHRLTCAIEDAGFEIRDSTADLTGMDGPGLIWAYGQGFPKSRNVAKDIDAMAGAEREVVGTSPDSHNRRAPSWQADDGPPHGMVGRPEGPRLVTAPATPEAAEWEGWGTALKPSWEPIVVARKPLTGTVAANVLEHGTGALNIAGCLIPPTGESRDRQGEASQQTRYTDHGGTDFAALPGVRGGGPAGRWPTNLVLGEEAATEMDRQSGVLTSGKGNVRRASGADQQGNTSAAYGAESRPAGSEMVSYGDTGGASRFFPVFRYEAKAAAHERPRLPDGTAHPTVKPVDLIAWLCRLVTPPGGLILDPFAGSGTTAEAAIVENFRCVLVEKDPKSAELILERLRKPIQPGLFGEPA